MLERVRRPGRRQAPYDGESAAYAPTGLAETMGRGDAVTPCERDLISSEIRRETVRMILAAAATVASLLAMWAWG